MMKRISLSIFFLYKKNIFKKLLKKNLCLPKYIIYVKCMCRMMNDDINMFHIKKKKIVQ